SLPTTPWIQTLRHQVATLVPLMVLSRGAAAPDPGTVRGRQPRAVMAQTTPGTRARILGAALSAFADRGYSGTSLNDIAEEVGIRRQSLLHHFPSKDELYRAVLVDSFSAWGVLVEEAVR